MNGAQGRSETMNTNETTSSKDLKAREVPMTLEMLIKGAEAFEQDAHEQFLLAEALDETSPKRAEEARKSGRRDMASANEIWMLHDDLKGIARGQRLNETIDTLLQLAEKAKSSVRRKASANYREMADLLAFYLP
jgi:hypothetical protein